MGAGRFNVVQVAVGRVLEHAKARVIGWQRDVGRRRAVGQGARRDDDEDGTGVRPGRHGLDLVMLVRSGDVGHVVGQEHAGDVVVEYVVDLGGGLRGGIEGKDLSVRLVHEEDVVGEALDGLHVVVAEGGAGGGNLTH